MSQVLVSLAKKLEKDITPIYKFKGYTIQVAYIKPGKEASSEKYRWANKLDKIDYEGAMEIVGDCIQTPIWIHRYSDNSKAIRFGIFKGYRNTKEAIVSLKLDKKHAQIIPIEFEVKNLDNFFYNDY